MLKKLYLSAAAWTGVGLASGLFYREFTKSLRFEGATQLSVAHIHALALGMIVIKGMLQALGNPIATSAGLAGIAGLGHMTITGALVWLFILLGRAVRAADAAPPSAELPGTPARDSA